MDAHTRGKTVFCGKADVYAHNRPSYPAGLIEWLQRHATLDAVADIGAGTGLFTFCLLPVCGSLTAIEPNPDMRSAFAKFLPQIPCLPGCAEATGLPGNSLSLVVAAQAFHWFDEQLFKQECQRILRKDGKLAVVWNNRQEHGVGPAYDAVCRRFCPDFSSGHVGRRTVAEGDCFLRESYFQHVEVFRCPNPVQRSEEQFIGDKLSRSYALTPASPDYQDFIAELRRVFHEFAKDGQVTEEYESVAYLGSF